MNHSLKLAFIAKYAPPLGSTAPVPAIRENYLLSAYNIFLPELPLTLTYKGRPFYK